MRANFGKPHKVSCSTIIRHVTSLVRLELRWLKAGFYYFVIESLLAFVSKVWFSPFFLVMVLFINIECVHITAAMLKE